MIQQLAGFEKRGKVRFMRSNSAGGKGGKESLRVGVGAEEKGNGIRESAAGQRKAVAEGKREVTEFLSRRGGFDYSHRKPDMGSEVGLRGNVLWEGRRIQELLPFATRKNGPGNHWGGGSARMESHLFKKEKKGKGWKNLPTGNKRN